MSIILFISKDLCPFIGLIHEDNRLHRAVALAGPALDAKIDVDVRLRFTLGDRIIFTAGDTRTTLDARC
jgi:hypothetical protein